MRGNTQRRTWAVHVAAALLGLAALIGVLFWAVQRPEFRSALSHRVDNYLKERLGARASVGDIRFGWSSFTIADLVAPLDSNGSQIVVAEARLAVKLTDLLRAPRQPLRIVKGIRAVGVAVTIAEPKGRASPGHSQRSYASYRVSPKFYDLLRDLDSLQAISVKDASLQYSTGDSCLALLQDLSLSVVRENSELRLSGAGSCLKDTLATLTLSGTMHADDRSGELSLMATIPAGPLPMLSGAPIVTSGGRISARMALRDTLATVTFAAAFDSVSTRVRKGEFSAPRLRVATVGDTLRLDPLEVSSSLGRVQVAGDLDLSSHEVVLFGHGRKKELLGRPQDSLSSISQIDSFEFDFKVCGPVTEPVIMLNSPQIRIAGQRIHDVILEAALESGELVVRSVAARHEAGKLEAHGRLELDSTLAWHAAGRFLPNLDSASGEWRTRVGAVEFDANGDADDFAASLSLFTGDRRHIGVGRVTRADSAWSADFSRPDGQQANVVFALASGQITASATDAHVILGAVVNDPSHLLNSFETLSITFSGNSDSGTLSLQSSLRADSSSLLSQVCRDVYFSGSYERQPDKTTTILGRWSGTNGDGQPFDGSADVSLRKGRLDIHRLFIDQASTASGFVDFAASELDLEVNIVDLPFDKLPLRPAFGRRAQVAGNTTGRVHVSGSLESPVWTAKLAVVDGAVLGVPGYWINLDADGQGLAIDLHQFELGRDIRRIVVAQGMIDIAQNQIAVTAETGAGRAEDFVTALLGRTGIVSGALDGRAAVSGQLTHPDVEVEFTINDGFLFKEIFFADLTASAQVHVGADGIANVSLPRFQFSKDTTYSFTVSANAALAMGGLLQFHLEGQGDFLNILDQMDREFAGYGSRGTLAMDIGGTVDRPQFTGGSLMLRDGQFTFPSATPAKIDANLDFQANGDGVQSGSIDLKDGDQSLILTVRGDWATAYPDLKPLVIPSPRLSLGVLEIRTGLHGMPVRIPGLMKPEWLGQVTSGADIYAPIVISAEDDTTLRISGDVELRNARVTFPFAGSGGTGKNRPVTQWLLDRLTEAEWNLDVFVGQGDHYDVEITGLKDSDLFASLRNSPVFSTLADYFDHLNVDAVIEPSELPLAIRGTIADSTFRLDGRLSSLRGRVEYLDQRFAISGAICDFDETDIMPVLEGRASTTGADTSGRRVPVYLTMYVIDRETQIRQRRGRLDDLTFVLEDDAGDPPETVIALLGYDVGSVSGKAQELVTSSVVRAIGRQWIDPIERRIEKWTPLDEVTLNPIGGKSTLARQQKQNASQTEQQLQSPRAVRFFTGSQLTVGKYITNDVFLTYTGELAESRSAPETGRLSLVHLWNLEYRIKPISPDLLLDFAVEYDEFERRRDESVSLKYSFALEP